MTDQMTPAEMRAAADLLGERFVSKVRVSGECWEWTAALDPKGYGRYWWNDRMWKAHRASYTALTGTIPRGLVLDHLCRNPRCVNPAHLEPVTNGENVRRGDGPSSRAREATHCPHGHAYEGRNLVVGGNGHRRCRTCIDEANAKNYSKRGRAVCDKCGKERSAWNMKRHQESRGCVATATKWDTLATAA